jgi:hypothetical protein
MDNKNFKLEARNPAFVPQSGASRRQAKLETNSKVPACRQAGNAQESERHELENAQLNR